MRLVLRPRRLLSRLMAVLLVTVGALPVHALDPNALPTGGRIAAGAATITQSGNRLNVNQSSDRAILNWSTFNIGANAAVSFVQPNSGSVALNRVLTSAGASDIQGRLTANGQVFLVNPSGVLFGKGAQVDVGGLVASTLDISDTDFLDGRYVFSRAGAAGSIVNQGTLNAAQGGYIALLAPEVRNEGVITARLGSVALAAGNQVTLDFAGDRLVSLAVDQAAVNALVENRHLIQADGGNVILAARSAGDLAATVVNNTGLIQATSVSRHNGVIRLEGLGTGVVASSGTIDASGRGAGETGGTVKLLGDRVGLMAGAVIDASGDAGGGSVLVGGNYQGQGPERNASFTFIDPTARIWADAVTTGDGGKVIAWADDTTRYYGSITARGGANGGNGGFVEVSGKDSLVFKGDVDTRAPHGATGMLLLDPANIVIANGSGDSVDDGDASTTSFSGAPSGTAGTVITTDNPGGGTLTLFESELQGIAATTNISLAATNAITINDLADNNLNLAQTAGNSVSFNSATFAMAGSDRITTAGGAVNITTTGAATVAGLSTGGGAIVLDVGGASTVSGVIAGTGTTLTKAGAGTLVLSGANSYTGLTTVSAGTLTAQNATALGTTAGATTVNSGATLDINGVAIGTEGLTLLGTGVGGNGALTGTGTALLGGTVAIGAASTIGGTGTLTLSGIVSGTALTKDGTGTLTLSGANTYTGLTTVSAGTLVANNNAALGTTAGATTVTSGATLAIQGGRTIADALTITGSGVGGTAGALRNISGNNTYTGAIALGAGGARINADLNTLTISGAGSITGAEALTIGGAGNATISKIIATGAGTLTKDGAGTLTLSGNNTYSGATTISAGTLTATTSANALGATGVASGTTIAAGATLAYGSSLTFAAESLTMSDGTLARSAGNPTMNGTIALTGANTVTGTAGTFTLGGIVSGTGSLAKTGAGTVVLSGNNTYSGATTISAGTLRATTSANALGATGVASGTTIGAGATLAYGSSLTFAAESLTMNGGTLSRSAGNPTMNGTIALTGANTVTGTAGTFTLGGIVSGTGSLAKTGAGTVVLSGNNTYSGATTISAGTLRATTSANALGATGVASGTTIGAGATLAYGSSLTFAAESLTMNGGTLSRSAGNPTMNGTIALTGANTVTGTAVSTFTLGGIISGTGSLAKTGTGTVVLAGANTYTGATSVSAGILQLNSINGLGDVAAGTTVTAGTLAYNGSLTFDAESLTLNGGTLSRVGGNPTMNGAIGLTGANTVTGAAGTFTLGGIVSGAGSLAKTGAGTVVLSGDNAYSGATTVSAGTLSAQHANALGTTAGATTVSSGATLDINGVAIGTEGLTLLGTGVGGNGALTGTGTASLGGTVAIGAASTIGGTGTLTLSGIVSGTALTKTGAGTLVLSGANSYTGLTTVSAGTLTAQNATALGTTAGATTVSSGATLDINGVAIGTEGLTLLGTGVGGNGALTGTGTASLGGTVAIGAASTIGGTGTLTLSGIVSGTALTKTGAGTLVLSGANSYTGLTTVSAGTLTAQNATALGTTAGATTVSSGATLDINGVAIGTEGLTLLGTGVGGNGALTGTGTASLGGTVAIGAASTIGGTGTLTLSGIVSGTALTKTGAGTLVLSGANSYTGLTTVSAGTLTAQNATALGTTAGATTVSSGATLDINGVAIGTEGLTLLGTGVGGNGALTGTGTASLGGTVAIGAASTIGGTGTLTLSGIVSGTALTKTGAGTLVLSGANSYTGLTTVSAGTLIANNNAALGTTLGGTSVAGGATLEITNGTTIGPEALNISGAGVGSNGALVVTAGSASIGGAVTLDASASIGGNGSLTLGGTVEDTVPGTSTLTQVGSGTLTFSGTVGATNALAGMTTSVGQTTVINGGSVTTSGDQSYAGSLATGGATALTATAGAITATGIVTATAGTLTLAAASTGDISFNNAGNNFGTVAITSGKDVILRDGNDLTLGTSGFAGTLTANASGKITLGGSLTAGGAGDAIVLVAGTDFDNSGNHSLNPGTGRWLVYSTDPGNDTRGAGLLATYDFKQYNTTFGGGILGSGDGFIYSLAPTVTAGLTGTASKVYNGNNSAALAPANYTVSGVVDGDTVTLNNPATGSYDDKNVGAGKTVTVTGIGFVSTENSGKPVYGYQLASTTANANIGQITPADYTAISGSKTYDGNVNFSNVSLAGVGGDSFTVATAAANSKDVVSATGFVSNGAISGNTGTDLTSNYNPLNLVTIATNTATITTADYTAISGSKTYDGNVNFSNVSLAGVGGDSFTVATAAANSKDVVSATGFVSNGAISGNTGTDLTSNYNPLNLVTIATNTATITTADYTAISGSKTYDGNVNFSNVSLAGVGGDSFTVATAAANSKDVVSATGFVSNGAISGNTGTDLTSNYNPLNLVTIATNTATITTADYTAISGSKTYDGNVNFSNVSLAGVGGDSFTVATAAANSKDVVSATGFVSNGAISGNTGTDLTSNYNPLNLVTIATNTATITTADYTAISGSKTYDGNVNFSNVSLAGVGGDSFTVATAAANSKDVVSATGFVSNGAISGNTGTDLTSNYNPLNLVTIATNTATITTADYTAISGSKTYDGNVNFSNVSLAGVGGDSFTVATAAANSKDVVSATGFVSNGAISGNTGTDLTSNYNPLNLVTIATNTATITTADYTAISGSKTYDGNVNFSNVSLAGVGGDSFTVATAAANSKDVVSATGFVSNGAISGNTGTDLTSNYNPLNLVTIATNTATITTADYTAISGSKTYDGNVNFSNVSLAGVGGDSFTVATAAANSKDVVSATGFVSNGAISGNTGTDLTSNYNPLNLVTIATNTATITTADYTAISGSKTYDGNVNFSNVSLAGVGGDSFTVATAAANSKDVVSATGFVSNGAISGNTGTDLTSNYNPLNLVTIATNTATITTADYTAISGSKTYDGNVNFSNVSLAGVGGDSFTVATAAANSKDVVSATGFVSNGAISGNTGTDLTSNYNPLNLVTIATNTATITTADYTAISGSKTYDGNVNFSNVSLAGVGGDSFTVATAAANSKDVVSATGFVSNGAISGNTGTDLTSNYNPLNLVTIATNTATITTADYTAISGSKTYDGNVNFSNVSLAGVGGDSFTVATAAANSKDVVSATGFVSNGAISGNTGTDLTSNYNPLNLVTIATNTATITTADYTAISGSKTYDGNVNFSNVSLAGVGGDSFTVATAAANSKDVVSATGFVSNGAISGNTGTDLTSNYNPLNLVTIATNTATITTADYTAISGSKTYDGNVNFSNVSLAGVGGDSFTVATAAANSKDVVSATGFVSNGAISGNTGTDLTSNYNPLNLVTIATNTATITTADYTAISGSKTYDGNVNFSNVSLAGVGGDSFTVATAAANSKDVVSATGFVSNGAISGNTGTDLTSNYNPLNLVTIATNTATITTADYTAISGSKTYDGNVNFSNVSLAGVGGDSFTVATAAANSKDVVSATGFVSNGAISGNTGTDLTSNYNPLNLVTIATNTATITTADYTAISGSKTYDGNVNFSNVSLAGVGGDSFTVATAAANSKDVVSATGFVSNGAISGNTGTDLTSNYNPLNLVTIATNTATITTADYTAISGSKTYDGNVNFSNVSLAGVGGDSFTVATAAANSKDVVSATGFVSNGAISGNTGTDLTSNYNPLNLVTIATNTATITTADYTAISGSKTYDGNVNFSNVSLAGVGGDSFTVATAAANSKDVVSATGFVSNGAISGNTGTDLTSNYNPLNLVTIATNTATITTADYTAISGSKTYDGNVNFSNVSLAGVGGDSFTVATAAANSKDVVSATGFVSNGAISGNTGTDLTSNYNPLNLVTIATNTATITTADYTAISGSKTYDGNVNFSNVSLAGVGGDSFTVATAAANSKDVVSATGFVSNGAISGNTGTDLTSNYNPLNLVTIATNTATITTADYTAISGSKTYDGNVNFSNVSLAGVGGDSFTVATAAANSKDVVSATGFVSNGAISGNTGTDLTSNYNPLNLVTIATNTATITTADYTAISGSKTYDGNVNFSNVSLAGVGGDSFTVATAAANSKDVVSATGFVSNGAISGNTGTDLTSNYNPLNLVTIATNTATITTADYTAISGSKTYDGNVNFSNVSLAGVGGDSFTVATAAANSKDVVSATGFVSNGAISGNTGTDLTSNYNPLNLVTIATNTATITTADYTAISGSKTYDGNVNFSNVSLAGVGGDSFTVATAAANSKDVVSATGFVSNGAISGNTGTDLTSNYNPLNLVTIATNTATITTADYTAISGSKTYDGNVNFSNVSLAGVGGDSFTVATAAANSKDVVSATGFVSNGAISGNTGTDLTSNYNPLNLVTIATNTATITTADYTAISGSKTYDGNVNFSNVSLAGVGGDSFTVATAAANSKDVVSATGFVSNGAISGNTGTDLTSNYNPLNLVTIATNTATITTADYTAISGSKTYDGNVNFSNVSLAGVGGDSFTVATAAANSKDVVSATGFVSNGAISGNTGTDLTSNYNPLNLVTIATNTATITTADYTAISGSKTYDGNVNFSNVSLAGVGGDSFTVATAAANSKDVVSATGFVSNGAISGNTGTDLTSNYNPLNLVTIATNTATITTADYTAISGSKTYDGNVNFSNVSLAGVGGDSFTVATAAANSKDVVSATGFVSNGAISGNTGTDLTSNYNPLNLVTIATNTATITTADYTAISGSKTYDGNVNFSNVSLAGVGGDSFTVATAAANSKDVVSATGFVSNGAISGNTGTDLTSNYNPLNLVTIATNTATITTADYTAISGSKTYDGNVNFSNVSLAGVGGDSFTVATAAANSKDVVSATGFVSNGAISGNTGTDLTSNYNPLNLVTIATNTATITTADYTAISGSKTYDGNVNFSNVSLAGVGGDSFTVATAAANSKDVVSATGFVSNGAISGNTGTDLTSNYNPLNLVTIATNTATITTADYTAISGSKTYDGNVNFSNVSLAGVGGDSFTVATAAANSKDVVSATGFVSNGAISGNTGTDLTSNYNPLNLVTIATNTATITTALLSVTADNKFKSAGTPNPPFTASYSGFVVGEGLADLGGSLLFSTPATVASPVGSYLVTPSGLTSSNYTIGFIDGLLFVTDPATVSNPAAAGAIASIFATDDRLIRTSVEPGGGLVDALNPQPPPTEKQVSAFISVVDCGINVPGSVCNSR